MADHELRKDMKGAMRKIRDVPPLVYSPYASDPLPPLEDEEEEELLRLKELERIRALIEVKDELRNFTLMDAYAAHVEGARRNAGAKELFQHAFLQFPTDLAITPETEVEMLAQGVAFINRTYGGNAVFHARLDRDERGQHGVDVFFAPRYQKTTAKGTEDWISLSKFSKELARERFGQRQKTAKNPKTEKFDPVFDKAGKPVMIWNDSGYFQGRALQDVFFEHLRDSMGLTWAERGQRKKTRDHDRLEPEEYAVEAEKRKLAAEIERQMKLPDTAASRDSTEEPPERPYEAVVGGLVADTRQKAEKVAHAATERAAEAERRLAGAQTRIEATQRQETALMASLGPLRAAVSAFDAFRAQLAAWEAWDENAITDIFRVTEATRNIHDTKFRVEPAMGGETQEWFLSSTYEELGESIKTGRDVSTEQRLRSIFQRAVKAGVELWVKVTSWGYENNNRHRPIVNGFSVVEPPAPPPAKPVISREVLSVLSGLDDKTLKAVRDINHP